MLKETTENIASTEELIASINANKVDDMDDISMESLDGSIPITNDTVAELEFTDIATNTLEETPPLVSEADGKPLPAAFAPLSDAKKLINAVDNDTDTMITELKQKAKILQKPVRESFQKKVAKRIKLHYAVGTATIILSLITMGIAILVSLNTPAGILSALNVAPLILIYLGLEILANVVMNRRLTVKFNLKELIITASLIVLTFITSLVTLLNSNTDYQYEHVSERMENSVRMDIAAAFSDIPNIHSVDVQLKLLSDNLATYKTLTGVHESDTLHVTVRFTEPHSSISKFAEQAFLALQILKDLPYSYKTVTFMVDDRYNKIKATLDGNFIKFATAEDIARYTYYFVDDGVDVDIPDIG